jgi:hypothetical protein
MPLSFDIYSEDFATQYRLEKYLAGGDIMRKASLGHSSLPCSPLQSDLNDEEVYSVESTGASVTLSSSVGLLYIYCSRLPSDRLVYSSLLIFIFHAAVYVVHNLLTLRFSVYLTSG